MTDAVAARRPMGRPKNPDNVESEVQSVPTGWEPMESAPTDGKTVVVRSADDEAGQHAESLAVFRNTRRFDPMRGKFVPGSYWACANSGGMKLAFEPVGWRPREGIV